MSTSADGGSKQARRILSGLALLLTAALTLGAPDNAAAAPATARAVYLAHARAAIRVLNERWGAGPSPGSDWRGINAWQRFVIVDALADYTALSGDRAELPRIKAAVINREGLDGNDDDLWAAIAALRVRDLTDDDSLLAYAKQTFGRITTQYWDNVCGGGLWWDHQRTYKNAITNSLAPHAAALLYLDTGEQAYLDWARREDRWIAASGMINADGLLNDGLTGRCANNGGPVFTYNQGAYLAGEALLSRIPGDPDDLARARRVALSSLLRLSSSDGVLTEPGGTLGQDRQIFKGVFIRHLGQWAAEAPEPDRRRLARYIRRNADRAWRARRPGDVFGALWSGRPGGEGAAAQASAIDLFNAAAEVSR